MTDHPKEPTKAQREMLEYMLKMDHTGGPGGWRGGSFINFYIDRMKREGRNYHPYGTGGRQHGQRRAGGTALANLAKAGWVQQTRISIGVPEYRLHPDAAHWLAHYAIESGQRRSHPLGSITVHREHGNGRWWASYDSEVVETLWLKSDILACPLLDT